MKANLRLKNLSYKILPEESYVAKRTPSGTVFLSNTDFYFQQLRYNMRTIDGALWISDFLKQISRNQQDWIREDKAADNV